MSRQCQLVDSCRNQLPEKFKLIVNTDYVVLCLVFKDSHVNTRGKRYQNVTSIRRNIQYTPKVYVSRPFLLMPWTIDLSIERFSYSRVTKLSINWNCSGKWCQRLSRNWNCLGNWFRRLSIIGFVQTVVFGDCLLIGIIWTVDVWYFVTIGTIWSNDFGVSRLIGIVLTIDFRDCPLIGINWTNFDVWRF